MILIRGSENEVFIILSCRYYFDFKHLIINDLHSFLFAKAHQVFPILCPLMLFGV